MSDAERIEQYQYLRREQAKNMRYFGVSVIGLILCLSVASGEGPSGGWPWSLGAIFSCLSVSGRSSRRATSI
ncbi:hypothetical protein LP415_18140 [Polaromonas sp. P1(28)-8]|nr:hypothetical protein LP415_18140 [Polaromonas sp. P1(28)-8]